MKKYSMGTTTKLPRQEGHRADETGKERAPGRGSSRGKARRLDQATGHRARGPQEVPKEKARRLDYQKWLSRPVCSGKGRPNSGSRR